MVTVPSELLMWLCLHRAVDVSSDLCRGDSDVFGDVDGEVYNFQNRSLLVCFSFGPWWFVTFPWKSTSICSLSVGFSCMSSIIHSFSVIVRGQSVGIRHHPWLIVVNLSWIIASPWGIRGYVGLWGCFGAIPRRSVVCPGVLHEGPWLHRGLSGMVRGNPGSSIALGMTPNYHEQSRCHYGFTTVEKRTFTEDPRPNYGSSGNSHVSRIIPDRPGSSWRF